jgi:F-type H+-transporting ATPase subunit a
MAADPLEHVVDTQDWHLFESLFGGVTIHLPTIDLGFYQFRVTKFMILEVVAAALVVLIYVPLARRASRGGPPRGAWDNTFESLLTFLRSDVAQPNLGEHEADKYTPFLWTLFLFVLFCNLLGMFPFLGSPTASIYATGALALCTMVGIFAAAIAKVGPVHYLKSLWPHLDVPIPVMGFVIKLLICVIEIVGRFIKNTVLAVRLFANMFAGHTVLAMILAFIVLAGNMNALAWGGITVASVLGVTALSLLELFVAFLQAYIFVFLAALFLGMELHPAH